MDLVQRQHCLSSEPWHSTRVASSTTPGKEYVVMVPYPEDVADELICSCDGFLYRGKCRHQQEAFEKLCRWRETKGPEQQTSEQARDHICPRCGGKTERVSEWI